MLNLIGYLLILLQVQIDAQKLLQIQVLIRHGARNPIYQRWNPQNDSLTDAGLLTAAGVRQHYVLGQLLKQDYVDNIKLIASVPNQRNMTIISTDINRTLMSAQSLILGMFTQNQSQPMNEGIIQKALPPMPNITITDQPQETLPFGYIPLPIHTRPKQIDFLLLGNEDVGCPYVEQIYQQNLQSKDAKYLAYSWDPFVKQLQQKGLNVSNFQEASELADDVACNRVNGKKLPNLTDIQFQALDLTRSIFLQFQHYRTQFQTQLQMSGFIEQIINNMQNHQNKNFYLFSAHDNNIFNILNLLGITNWQCYQKFSENNFPFVKVSTNKFQEARTDYCQEDNKYTEFASNIIFELWEGSNQNDMFVKLKYNGKYMKICQQRTQECPYNQFIKELQDQVIPNYLEICESKTSMKEFIYTYVEESGFYMFLNLISAMFIFFTILSMIIGIYYYRKHKTMERIKSQLKAQSEIEL